MTDDRREAAGAWEVCAICAVMAVFAWGAVFYGNGVYLPILHQRHGWSVGEISTAMLFFSVAGVLSTLLVGRLVDRVAPGSALLWGALAIGGGLLLIGHIDALWQLYAIYGLLGLGYPALGTAGVSVIMSQWFRHRYGLGLAIALSGASLGGSTFPAIMAWLSARIGFPATMELFGVVLIAGVLPLAGALALLDRGQRRSQGPVTRDLSVWGLGVAVVVRRPLFWAVTVACGVGLGAQVGFLAHQINFLATSSSVVTASLVTTATVVVGALGRFLFGWLSGRLHPRGLIAACFALQACGQLAIALASDFEVQIGLALLIGFTVGAIVMLPPILLRHLFGNRDFGQIFGVTNVALYIGMGGGPWLVGVLRDLAGSYGPAFMVMAGGQVLAAVVLSQARGGAGSGLGTAVDGE